MGYNQEYLKLVAGELRGKFVPVRIKVRHPDTKVTLFNEELLLHAGSEAVIVNDSTNPESGLVGTVLFLSDLRNEVMGELDVQQYFLRKLLRLRFKAEIEQYFEIIKDLETANLPELMPEHFQAKCSGDGFYRRQTDHGPLVVGRQTEWENAAVSFTLIRAPKGHRLASRPDAGAVVVYFINGRPARYEAGSLQALLAAELSSFGKVTTVTSW